MCRMHQMKIAQSEQGKIFSFINGHRITKQRWYTTYNYFIWINFILISAQYEIIHINDIPFLNQPIAKTKRTTKTRQNSLKHPDSQPPNQTFPEPGPRGPNLIIETVDLVAQHYTTPRAQLNAIPEDN